MILLDTNVISEFMRTRADIQVRDWINQYPATSLFICSISQAEMLFGVASMPNGQRKELYQQAAEEIFSTFTGQVLFFDNYAAKRYAEVMTTRRKIGRPIDIADAQIASIALAHNMSLATRNTKDFTDIPHLQLINPWESS